MILFFWLCVYCICTVQHHMPPSQIVLSLLHWQQSVKWSPHILLRDMLNTEGLSTFVTRFKSHSKLSFSSTSEHTHGFNDFTNKNIVSLLTTEQTVCLASLISVRRGPVETLDWVHTWCQCQALVVGNNVVPFPRLRGQYSGKQSAVRPFGPRHRAATVGLCRFSHFRDNPQSAIVSENEPLLLWVCSSLFRMNWLVSMNRSTQLTKHISALESSFGPGLSIHFSCRVMESFREGTRHDGCNYTRMQDVTIDVRSKFMRRSTLAK